MSAKAQLCPASETQEKRAVRNEFWDPVGLRNHLIGESCQIRISEQSEKQCPRSPYCASAHPSTCKYTCYLLLDLSEVHVW